MNEAHSSIQQFNAVSMPASKKEAAKKQIISKKTKVAKMDMLSDDED